MIRTEHWLECEDIVITFIKTHGYVYDKHSVVEMNFDTDDARLSMELSVSSLFKLKKTIR